MTKIRQSEGNAVTQAVRQFTLRGVPMWVLRQYLEQLGASETDIPLPAATDPDAVTTPDGAMAGDDWRIAWRTERRQFHPLLPTKIEEHYFVLSAVSEDRLEAVFDRFMMKAQRGGG